MIVYVFSTSTFLKFNKIDNLEESHFLFEGKNGSKYVLRYYTTYTRTDDILLIEPSINSAFYIQALSDFIQKKLIDSLFFISDDIKKINLLRESFS